MTSKKSKTKVAKDKDPTTDDFDKEVDFITGGNGRMGRALAKALLKKGDTVRALVPRRDVVLDLPSGVIPYVGDIRDAKVIKDAVGGADNIFHLAAIVSEYKAKTDEIIRVNVEGTRNVLEAAESLGVKHFLFTSTLDVYGIKRKEILTEDSKLMPKDKYGYSKALAEKVIGDYKSTVPSTIFRLATIYGPEFEESFFKIFQALKEQKIYIIGNGQNHLAILHIYDVLQALLLARMTDKSKGRVYNVTDGVNHTLEELLNTAADMIGAQRPTRHISEFIVKVMAKRRGLDSDELRFLTSDRIVDISRAKEELGFTPMVDIKQGGKELADSFLNKKFR